MCGDVFILGGSAVLAAVVLGCLCHHSHSDRYRHPSSSAAATFSFGFLSEPLLFTWNPFSSKSSLPWFDLCTAVIFADLLCNLYCL